MKILLLSPYDAMSHQYWWRGLKENLGKESLAGHDFTVVTLPPRFFSWRFRGNSLSFAFDARVNESYDLLIATSMTDLSSLRGMCPSLCAIPTIVYFHENQFAYPDNPSMLDDSPSAGERLVERQITSIYTAISADLLLFNSCFNRDSFFSGAGELMDKLPDAVPKGVIMQLEQKSSVQSVPLRKDTFAPLILTGSEALGRERPNNADVMNVVWNHRWEFDKGLDALESLVESLLAQSDKASFVMHIIGQSFRKVPAQMKRIRALLEAHHALGQFGFLETRADYLNLLRDSHVVLSTAIHEFQGIAVLEAIACGCVPLVPDALAYREFVPGQHRYKTNTEAVRRLLSLTEHHLTGTMPAAPNVDHLSWENQTESWLSHIEQAYKRIS